MDRVVDLVYDLLNEYDIEVWRDIEYIELAEKWVEIRDRGMYNENDLKAGLKAFLFDGV